MSDRLVDTRKIAKRIARVIVGYGSNVIVRGVISSNVEIDRAIPKLAASVAAYAISDAVSRRAKDEIDARVDSAFDMLLRFVPEDSVWAKILAETPVEDEEYERPYSDEHYPDAEK